MSAKYKVGFLGAGKMGGIILKGMVSAQLADAKSVTIYDVYSDASAALGKDTGVAVAADAQAVVEASDVVFICVKPQQFAKAAEPLKGLFEGKCAVSIMAGVKSGAVSAALGGAKVVRVMPNVSCLVGQGAAAVAKDTGAPKDVLDFVHSIFESLGCAVLVDEAQMDAVTALSGSGPAYVFMMMEAMTDAGVRVGLDRATSAKLAVQTVLGAATMAKEGGLPFSELRAQVSSPGGTTIAATSVLESSAFRGSVIDAITAAWKRSIELGK